MIASVYGIFICWSLLLFWKARRRLEERYLTLSVLVIFLGFVAGALLTLPFPVLSITNTLSVSLIGFSVISRQIFNPLREVNIQLEKRVVERTQQLETAFEKVEEKIEERTAELKHEIKERKRVEGDLEQRALRLELIAEVGRRTTSILELGELLGQAVELIRETFNYYNVTIFLVEGKDLVLKAATIPELRSVLGEVRIPIGKVGVTGWVAEAGEPLLVPDVSRESRYHVVRDDIVTRSELAERNRTEADLRESEEQFRNLAEESPNMIFINSGGRIVFANEKCEEMLKYSRKDYYAPGFEFASIIAPDSLDLVREKYRRHMAGEDVEPYEYALQTRDGKRVEVINSSKLITYGGEGAILGIVTDITNRKRFEQLLQALNNAALALATVLNPEDIFPTAGKELLKLGLSCAIFLVDGNRLVLEFVNYSIDPVRRLEKLTGLSLKGFSFDIDRVDVFREAVSERKAVVLDTEEAIRRVVPRLPEPVLRRVVATLGICKSISAPLIVEQKPIGLLVVHSDDLVAEDAQTISVFGHQIAAAWRKTRLMQDLRGSLEELEHAQKQLLHSQKMEAVGKLAGGVAHDFNNLLTAIHGYTEMVLTGIDSGETLKTDMREIQQAVKRGASLTRQLLAFSSKQIFNLKVLNLNHVIGGLENFLKRTIGKDIELHLNLEPGLKRIKADPTQVEQVVMNLAVNARDAMPSGGCLKIETVNTTMKPDLAEYLHADKTGPWVLLTVADDGIGMSEETQKHLFEPFFTTKEHGEGTGLGLSTVYGIVSQTGGYITVHSVQGEGARFEVFLPATRRREAPPSRKGSESEDLGGSETILLAEDEDLVRDLAKRVLSRYGYSVLTARHGREAAEIYRQKSRPIHLLITDVVMPGGMSGPELGEHLTSQSSSIKVLFISGYTDGAVTRFGMSEEEVEFLPTPFTPKELARKVREVLDSPEKR